MKRLTITLTASLVALGVGLAGFALANSGSANPTPQARSPKLVSSCRAVDHAPNACSRAGIPPFVTACLAAPASERAACFAAAGGAQIPDFVKRCLAVPPAERGACFAAAGGAQLPDFVKRCLAMAPADRPACFQSAVQGTPTTGESRADRGALRPGTQTGAGG